MRRASLVLLAVLGSCRSCADLTTFRAYDCDPGADAGQCGPWRCSRATKTCLDPDAGQEAACLGDGDCGGSWKCAPVKAGAVAGECYDPVVGGSHACTRDEQCLPEQGWFCDGVTDTCMPVPPYQSASRRALSAVRLSPVRDLPRPDLFTMGRYVDGMAVWASDAGAAPKAPQFSGYLAATWRQAGDGGTLAVLAFSDGLQVQGQDVRVAEFQYPLRTRPAGLATVSGQVAALDGTGAVTLYSPFGARLVVDAGVALVALSPVDHTLQKGGSPVPPGATEPHFALALGADGVLRRIHSNGAVDRSATVLGAVGPARMVAAVPLDAGMLNWAFLPSPGVSGWVDMLGDAGVCPLASLGDIGAPLGAGRFAAKYRVVAGHLPLDTVSGQREPNFLLELARRDAGAGSGATELLFAQRPQRCGDPDASPMYNGPSQACPCGAPLIAAWATNTLDPSSSGVRAFVRCPEVSCAGQAYPERTWLVAVYSDSPADRAEVAPWQENADPWRPGGWTVDTASPAMLAVAGTDGHVWHQQDRVLDPSGAYGMRSLLLDRAPDTVVRVTFPTPQGPRDHLAAFGNDYAHDWVAGWGFVSNLADYSNSKVPLRGNIAEEPTLAYSLREVVDLSWIGKTGDSIPYVARLPDDAPDFSTYVGAWIGPQRRVLLSSRDTLYTAKLPNGPFEPPATLTAVAVPTPGLAIRSLAAREVDGGVGDGGLFEAWTITAQGLSRTVSENGQDWVSSSQASGKNLGPMRRVWADGSGTMVVGYASGHLTQAGSGALLTTPFDGGLARQYAVLCGESLLLATGGLFRLQPEGVRGYRRSWVSEPFSSMPQPPLAPAQWASAQLNEGLSSVFLSTAGGEVWELAFAWDAGVPSCP